MFQNVWNFTEHFNNTNRRVPTLQPQLSLGGLMHLLGVPVSDWTKMVSWRHVIGFHGLKDLKTNTKHKTGWCFQLLFIFTPGPYLGKWSNLTNIFHLGWNHQLEKESWCGSNSDPVTWEKAMLLHQPGFHLRPSLRLFFFRDKKTWF